MQAVNNVNLSSGKGNFSNNGLISALANDINIETPVNTNINFNNTGGNLQALFGNINFRDADYTGTANLTVTGGNLQANAVNMYSGQGDVNVNVDQLQGVVNVSAQCAHITAATNLLDLGTMNISGDPTFYNTTGDVLISGDLIFLGQSLAIVAEGNIETISGVGIIDTSSSTGNGGNILMVAGANFTVSGKSGSGANATSGNADTSATLTITGSSQTGGFIDLTEAGGILGIHSFSSAVGGSGGDVDLVAFAGSEQDSGMVVLPSNSSIRSGGHDSGTNGNVNIIAGAYQGTAVSIGSINTAGGTGGGGNVSITSSQPQLPEGSVVLQPGGAVDFTAGTFDPGGDPGYGSVTTGDINVRSATVSIYAGGELSTGFVHANGVAAQNGGSIELRADTVFVNGSLQANASESGFNGGLINIWTRSGDISVVKDISANGGGEMGDGGGITIVANSGGVFVGGNVTVNASGDAWGGTAWISADKNVLISGSLSANGSGTGGGGVINVKSVLDTFSELTTPDTDAFVVGGATTNGIGGIVSAEAGQDGMFGSGGSIYLLNAVGTGGVVVPSWQNLNVAAAPAGGNGGSIQIIAGNGALLVPQGQLSVNGVSGASGGTILLDSSQNIVVCGTNGQPATGPLALSANGDGNGQGGDIHVGQAGNLTIGNCAGQISISTLGGGGYVEVWTSGNLTVNTAALNAGNAPLIQLTAGQNGSGNLLVRGSLIADSVSGIGGFIILSCNSGSPFVIGGATTNGITGILSASAGANALGDGGTIHVIADGTGGITVSNESDLTASAGGMGGNGGTIILNAGGGILSMAQGTLSVDGLGSNTYDAPVPVNVSSFNYDHQSPSPCCNGGTLYLEGAGLKVIGTDGFAATGTLQLSANGSAAGNAGSISILTSSGDLAIGHQAGDITLSAVTGNTYASPVIGQQQPWMMSAGTTVITTGGDAMGFGTTYTGTIYISSGGNLQVDPSAISAPGAYVSLIADTANNGGSLLISGSLSANDFGRIYLVSTYVSSVNNNLPCGCINVSSVSSSTATLIRVSGSNGAQSPPPDVTPAAEAAFSSVPTVVSSTQSTGVGIANTANTPASSLASLFSRLADTRPSLRLGMNEATYNGDVLLTEVNSTPDTIPPKKEPADDTVVDTGDSEP